MVAAYGPYVPLMIKHPDRLGEGIPVVCFPPVIFTIPIPGTENQTVAYLWAVLIFVIAVVLGAKSRILRYLFAVVLVIGGLIFSQGLNLFR